MALDNKKANVNPGDIITIRAIVESIEAGESGMNVRCKTYDNGGSVPATRILVNSTQVEKT